MMKQKNLSPMLFFVFFFFLYILKTNVMVTIKFENKFTVITLTCLPELSKRTFILYQFLDN
jgi:hypothetical protein